MKGKPMKKQLLAVLPLAATAGMAAAGCSSASTSSSHPSATKAAVRTGVEHLAGSVGGKAAASNGPPTFPVKWTGPVTTTGTFSPSGPPPVKGQRHTFPTAAGNLVAVVTSVPENGNKPQVFNRSTCQFADTTVVDFNVVGSASTGAFKGASGPGQVSVVFRATLPKLKSGVCNESNAAVPTAASATFTGTISPLTVR
jgi:hypothetical protein